MGWKKLLFLLAVTMGGVMLLVSVTAFAQSSSDSYKVEEVFFGTGGELNACSDTYCSKQSAGETAAGRTASASYAAQVGFNTTDTPMLEVSVNGSVDFGVLTPNETAAGVAHIQVRTYLADGYTLVISGLPPNHSGHTLSASTIPEPSQPGKEQFGINFRQNTVPTVGTDPQQVPTADFSFGTPTADYNTPDTFKYQDGSIVAYSDSSTGQTNYTLSLIANASNLTPAGQYNTKLSVVVIAAF